MINQYGRGGVVQISKVFGLAYTVLPEGSSENGLFRHLFNHVFRNLSFRKYISYEGRLFWKIFEIWFSFQKWKNKLTINFFSFWDNCIWVCSLKLCLLRREYVSLAVNMVTNILKTLHVTKRDLLQLNCVHSD